MGADIRKLYYVRVKHDIQNHMKLHALGKTTPAI